MARMAPTKGAAKCVGFVYASKETSTHTCTNSTSSWHSQTRETMHACARVCIWVGVGMQVSVHVCIGCMWTSTYVFFLHVCGFLYICLCCMLYTLQTPFLPTPALHSILASLLPKRRWWVLNSGNAAGATHAQTHSRTNTHTHTLSHTCARTHACIVCRLVYASVRSCVCMCVRVCVCKFKGFLLHSHYQRSCRYAFVRLRFYFPLISFFFSLSSFTECIL